MNPVATSPWLVFAVAALPLCACAGSLTYSAEAIEARVVDAETRQPLEGVVVTANWQLEEGTFGGNVQAGQLMVMEAVTDRNGAFRFPAWGPKQAPKGHLVNDDPQLLLFKPGYEYRRLNNDYSGDREMRLRTVRRSKWSGKTISLKKFQGTTKGYSRNFEDLNHDLQFATRQPEACNWISILNAIRVIHRQRQTFEEMGVRDFFSIDEELLGNDAYFSGAGEAKCGSPQAAIMSNDR